MKGVGDDLGAGEPLANHLSIRTGQIDPDQRINAREVRRIISELIDVHGAPEHIRSDNGSEFIEGDLRD